MRLSLPVFMFCLLLSACGKQSLAPAEYMKWVEDESNGLRVKRSLSDYVFTLQYRPVDYMLAQESGSGALPAAQLAQRRKELEQSMHFNFIIGTPGGEVSPFKANTTPEGYFERVNHFLTDGYTDFKLRSGNDTFDCTLCHAEQTYGLAPENIIVLAFEPRTDKEINFTSDLQLVYEDKVLGTGAVKMKIEKEKLDKIPVMN